MDAEDDQDYKQEDEEDEEVQGTMEGAWSGNLDAHHFRVTSGDYEPIGNELDSNRAHGYLDTSFRNQTLEPNWIQIARMVTSAPQSGRFCGNLHPPRNKTGAPWLRITNPNFERNQPLEIPKKKTENRAFFELRSFESLLRRLAWNWSKGV